MALSPSNLGTSSAERDRLDSLADLALDALSPLTFTVARTPAEIDAVLRMRYECVTEMGWARAEDYPDGRERDHYDEGASLIVCCRAEEIVASGRVVPPDQGELLPAEREFRMIVEPPGRPVEVGRIIIPNRHRGDQSHLILAGLFARSWLVVRELGYDRVISTASDTLVDLYRGLGIIVSVLSTPKLSWGEERTLIELAATERSMSALARAVGVDVHHVT